MSNRTKFWGPNPSLLTRGDPAERTRYIIWMEFYSTDETITLEDINVVTLTDFGKDWTAYVEVHDDGSLYRVHYHRGTNIVNIEIYNYMHGTTLTIS